VQKFIIKFLNLLKLFPKKICLELASFFSSSLDELEQIQKENERLDQKCRELKEKLKTDNIYLTDLLHCGTNDLDFLIELIRFFLSS
jgi:hypothetical protein